MIIHDGTALGSYLELARSGDVAAWYCRAPIATTFI